MTTPTKLPSPPTRESHVSESHHLIRERNFSASSSLDEIKTILRNSHSTGTLSIDFADGGVGSIQFSERKKVTFE